MAVAMVAAMVEAMVANRYTAFQYRGAPLRPNVQLERSGNAAVQA